MTANKKLLSAIFAMQGAQMSIETNVQQGFGRVLGGGIEWARVVTQYIGK